jgi:starch phosphorylase
MEGKVLKTEHEQNGLKISRSQWIDTKQIRAMAYDSQNAGYNTFNTVSVRLWTALPTFGEKQQSEDQYKNIIDTRKECEKITCAPYPKDPGQSLRIQELVIKQQYFFVSATLKDILRRFQKKNNQNWDRLPEKVSVFLLDMHHAVGILEMLRLLIDEHQLTFHQAFYLAQKCFSTVSTGSLEELSMNWNVEIFSRILPRHMELLTMIDYFFVEKMRQNEKIKSDMAKMQRLQIITFDDK